MLSHRHAAAAGALTQHRRSFRFDSIATGFWKKRELCTAGFTAERVHAERGFPLELGTRQLAA